MDTRISAERSICRGITECALHNYGAAEELFAGVVRDSRDRDDQQTAYACFASFGRGLAEGMKHRDSSNGPRQVVDVAKAAGKFYRTLTSFRDDSLDLGKYRALGRSCVALGLQEEGIRVLYKCAQSDILDCHKLAFDAEELATTDGSTVLEILEIHRKSKPHRSLRITIPHIWR